MRLIDLLRKGTSRLKEAGVVAYEKDARLLLESVLGKSRTELYLAPDFPVTGIQQEKYIHCIDRRKKKEPVAYILGEQEFWSLPFHVSPDVLIPRPETEFLLDRVLALTEKENIERGKILDLCAGSGVISTVLAQETGRVIFASDISKRALMVTKKNSWRHNLSGKVIPVVSDLLRAFCDKPVFSLIVSNPPYVSRYDLDNSLEQEVCDFEPHLALDGGDYGLEIIMRIRQELPKVLLGGGQFFMEIGADQGERVRELFARGTNYKEFQHVQILSDYAGRDRILYAKMINSK